jgi:acetolactate synthase-1/2/3 large subunit
MNGAELLLESLVEAGVDTCFANPGTSEMHLVAAIGRTPGVRAVLCLFEGVASGAADGYARMTDRPAMTLLHLGSGFSNAMANLHNARRAHVPLLNVVGDHASYHLELDAPLTSDVPAHAHICSSWVRVPDSAATLAQAGQAAVRASLQGSGRIATLITPANHAWDACGTVTPHRVETTPEPGPEPGLLPVQESSVAGAQSLLVEPGPSALFLGGRALRADALEWAGRIARKTGCRLICETFTTRLQRGAGRVSIERLPYFAEQAAAVLQGLDRVILVGAREPVSFFAYPGKPGRLLPEGCRVHELATVDHEPVAALRTLAEALGANEPAEQTPLRAEAPPPRGLLTPLAVGQSLSLLMPEDAIVSDEAATCGLELFPATAQAPRHDWLMLTGGAIGQGMPLSLGASIACPDRKVVALQADGSAMYTLQALWSMAREDCDVTVIILNNRSYAILNIEMARVGAIQPTAKALSMLDLSRPDIDWVSLAEGMGVRAARADSAEAFHEQLEKAMQQRGPQLIEALVHQEMPG